MSSLNDVYLPSLSKCLNGDVSILSWDEILNHLLLRDSSKDLHPVSTLLESPAVQNLLSRPVPAFPPPSTESRNRLETKTAAINVSPSSNGTYDIAEITQDALWLSQETNIDECEALRLTVLEWQQRPQAQLEECMSDSERASLREAIGSYSEDAQKALLSPVSEWMTSDIFHSSGSRRVRILLLYLTEQTALLTVFKELSQISFLSKEQSKHSKSVASNTAHCPNALIQLAVRLCDPQKLSENVSDRLADYISALERSMDQLQNDVPWDVDDLRKVDFRLDWILVTLRRAIVLMELIVLLTQSSTSVPAAAVVMSWFRCMDKCRFFVELPASFVSAPAVLEMTRNLAATTSLIMLRAPLMVESILRPHDSDVESSRMAESPLYLFDLSAMKEIHGILLSAANFNMTPAVLSLTAWGLILYVLRDVANFLKDQRDGRHVQRTAESASHTDVHNLRRSSGSSSGSLQQSLPEDILDSITHNFEEDTLEQMLYYGLADGRVFNALSDVSTSLRPASSLVAISQLRALQDLIRLILPVVQYSAELVTAQVDILYAGSGSGLDEFPPVNYLPVEDIPTVFLRDEFLREQIYNMSASRFPYEALPFLQLSRALIRASSHKLAELEFVTARLQKMDSFAQPAHKSFSQYRTIHEDENANSVCLDSNSVLMINPSSNMTFSNHVEQASSLIIPRGTEGIVISELHPPVILWRHHYPLLPLLGSWLDSFRNDQLDEVLVSVDRSTEVVAEIILLLCDVLNGTLRFSRGDAGKCRKEAARDLLDEIGSYISADQDLVSVIFDIFEVECTNLRLSGSESSCEVLIASVKFMNAICSLDSTRIWPLLAKSSLFNSRSGDGIITAMLSSTDNKTLTLDFFEACVHLYRSLVYAAIHYRSQSVPNAGTILAGNQAALNWNFPRKIMEMQLATVTEMLSNSIPIIFTSDDTLGKRKLSIIGLCLNCFDEMIHFVYGVDDNLNVSEKVTGTLATSAASLIQTYRSLDQNHEVIVPIRLLLASLKMRQNYSHYFSRSLQSQCFDSAISFCTTISCLGQTLSEADEAFERYMLNLLPIFVRLTCPTSPFRETSMELLSALLDTTEKRSLSSCILASLGPVTSRNFCENLRASARQSDLRREAIMAWSLLTKLLRKNHQWFAVFLLTGTFPQASSMTISGRTSEARIDFRGGSLLTMITSDLSFLDDRHPELIASILNFVVIAQENWIWAQTRLHEHPDFICALMAHVRRFVFNHHELHSQFYQNEVATKTALLAVVYLHGARSSRDMEMIKKMIPFLNWLTEHAVEVSGFNKSLHTNLARNFSSKYTPYTLTNFKRTSIRKVPFGEEYFYDTALARTVLTSDSRLDETSHYVDKSFLLELVRANLNLSLVQSQIDLFHGLEALCIDHCGFFAQDLEVQKIMAVIIRKCLQANEAPFLADPIFESLSQARLDLSLALIRTLVRFQAKGSSMMSLLEVAWTSLQIGHSTYESALLNSALSSYRTSLYILLLTLQLHVQKGHRDKVKEDARRGGVHSNSLPIILEITEKVVVRGMVTIVQALRDRQDEGVRAYTPIGEDGVGERDIELVLSMIQTILRLATIPQTISQLSSHLSSLDLIRACMLLYSWSHILTNPETEHDPVFASLSLRFLSSISSLPPTAEELAVEGVLTLISTSRMTSIFRSKPGGVSHYETRPPLRSLYNMWNSGLLPLCLNLLASVGRAMATEVSAFLNQFPEQLLRASHAFAGSDRINSPVVVSITLGLAKEAATIALISRILSTYRNAGPSAGVDPTEVVTLSGYDEHKKELIEDIESVLENNQKHLKSRILPLSGIEVDWWNHKLENSISSDLLEEKVAAQLRTALSCLRDDELDT